MAGAWPNIRETGIKEARRIYIKELGSIRARRGFKFRFAQRPFERKPSTWAQGKYYFAERRRGEIGTWGKRIEKQTEGYGRPFESEGESRIGSNTEMKARMCGSMVVVKTVAKAKAAAAAAATAAVRAAGRAAGRAVCFLDPVFFPDVRTVEGV